MPPSILVAAVANAGTALNTLDKAVSIDPLDAVVGSVQVQEPAATAGNVVLKLGTPALLVTNTASLASPIKLVTSVAV